MADTSKTSRESAEYTTAYATPKEGSAQMALNPRNIARPADAPGVASQNPALLKEDFFQIALTHIPTATAVKFNGWLINFGDEFASTWTPETVYGRQDPIATFGGTQRTISLSFDVVSNNHAEASRNLFSVNQLIQFLYPTYKEGPRSFHNTLEAAPLIGMRWANLAASAGPNQKLTGYLNGISYSPDLSQGGFLGSTPTGTSEALTPMGTGMSSPGDEGRYNVDHVVTSGTAKKIYIPKSLSISLTYAVLHTHLMGWHNKKFAGDNAIASNFPHASGEKIQTEEAFQRVTNENTGNTVEAAQGVGSTESANAQEVLQSLQGFLP